MIDTNLHAGRDLVGRKLDDYYIASHLARGGMGDVYVAFHGPLRRPVAIKTARVESKEFDFLQRRLIEEARCLAAVDHPNVVHIYDLGFTDNGLGYVVMELLEGRTVKDVLDERLRLSVPDALRITKEVARGLAAFHRQDFVCADVKPENIMLVAGPLIDGPAHRNWVRMFDLGAVQAIERGGQPQAADEFVMGTVLYMSPEAALGKTLDERSDVYSVGILLHEMLSGLPPFVDEDPRTVMKAHVSRTPPPVSSTRPDLAAGCTVDRVVERCLAKDPEDRPGDMYGLLEYLDQAEEFWREFG